jgi:RimJ/RimL family protein N-acetyltransferase
VPVHLETERLTLRQFTEADEAVNLASRRVLEKCGLTLLRTFHLEDDPHPIEGAGLGHVEYQLTRTDWEAANRAK